MKHIFKSGDTRKYHSVVKPADVAAFHGVVVHGVCSTFALARDIEWTTRQFVLDMKDENEEGVGTFLHIRHVSPAFMGDEIIFTGVFESLAGNELICAFEARVKDRLIASGRTGQKILTLDKIKSIFAHG